MECPDENELTDFVESRLGPAEKASLETHLDACADCLAVACEMARSDGRGAPAPRGEWIGRYELLEMVGEGAMGSVYAAHDPQLDRKVALKVVRSDRVAQESARARLLREARAMAKLSHPNVVAVHDAGDVDDRVFIAMELLEGTTLAAWLREASRPWRAVLGAFLSAGRGLVAAHEAGVVHRDFKPENVLVERSGRIAVTDFGLAADSPGKSEDPREDADEHGARPERPSSAALTRSGARLGTPSYMSPEQHRGAPVDARTDQFSFAVALYEGLYRERPFAGGSIAELADAVARGEVRPAPRGTPIPRRFRAPLLRALAPDPGDRFSSMGALLSALERAASQRFDPRVAAASALALVLAAIVAGGFAATHRAAKPRVDGASIARTPPKAEHPPEVLILGIENGTDDPVFDGTLEVAMRTALGFSPVLHTYARTTLRTLARTLDFGEGPIDERVGEKLLARDGGAVFTLRGAIRSQGAGYRLSVRVKDARDGGVILQTTRDAADAATVMPALGRLAWDLRALLGERPPDDPRELEQTGMSLSLEADHEYSVGHDLSASGQRAAAVAHLERAVALDPRLARAHSALGAALDTLGRYAEAEKELRLALAGDGLGPWERAMFSGLYQSQIGDYDRAIDSYTEALRRRPGDVGTEINLGIQTNYARRAARAVEIGRRAVAGHPTHLYARTDLARWLLSAGDVDAAQREAATVIQRFPHPLSVNYVTAAAAAALAGRRSEALDALAKLRAVDRSAADADLADLALAEGRLDDAASILEAAIAADKTEHDVDGTAEKRALLAETYLRRGDAKRALAAARLAIARGSRSTILIAGEVAIDAGSTPDEALAALARQDAQEPRAYAKILAAHALRSGGDPRAALAAYDEAERILPTWTGRFGAARASLALRSYAEAERALHGCVALDGGVSNVFPAGNTSSLRYRTLALHELARALDAANDASARSAYEAFLAHEPDAQHDPLAADARRRVTSRSP